MAELAGLARLFDNADERERLAILEKIVSRLSFNERKALVQMVSKCNDVLTALPVELILEVLTYLPVLQTWKLQLVCKQWHSALSSDRVLRSLVARWECHNTTDTASNPSTREPVRAKLRRMQAMRLGRPVSSRLFTDHIKSNPGVLLTQSNRYFALKGSRLAYIRSLPSGGTDCVVVVDLLSDKKLTFFGTARERIMSVTCTANIVAFVTYAGKLYVPNLADWTSVLRAIQLPSADITAFNADGKVVCLALKGSSPGTFTLVVYDCVDSAMTAFELESPRATERGVLVPKALLVNAKDSIIDVFSKLCITSGAYGSREDVFVEHRRYSFTGQYMTSSCWRRLNRPRSSKVPFELGDPHATGHPGRFVLRTKALQSGSDRDWSRSPPSLVLLMFDYETATLGEHCFGNEGSRRYASQINDYTSLMIWKDVEFRAVGNLLFTSTENEPAAWGMNGRYRLRNGINMIKLSGVSGRDNWRYDDSEYSILVNDSFIVGFEQTPSTEDWQSRIKIFCFDETLKWAGARDTRLWELNADHECKFPSWDGTTPALPR